MSYYWQCRNVRSRGRAAKQYDCSISPFRNTDASSLKGLHRVCGVQSICVPSPCIQQWVQVTFHWSRIAGPCKPARVDGDVHCALVACRPCKTTLRGRKGKVALGVTRLCWLNSGTAQLRCRKVVGRWGADRRWTRSPEILCRMAVQARPPATSTGTAEKCGNHTDTSVYTELCRLKVTTPTPCGSSASSSRCPRLPELSST